MPSEEELLGARWPVEDLDVPECVYRPIGCRNCANTGYRGRIAIHEVMPVSPEIESLTIRRASGFPISVAVRITSPVRSTAGRSSTAPRRRSRSMRWSG